ncbi:ThiF family adenylyltransferase [Anoxybacillus sp. ST4]|uniref:HesA/MoeB/ThiF family protein n=1 Tax=Anoxybacillus sp. ST4 TaxID=2864181 RepID=UPI001C63C589|nr:ThiF family adenylyltransferase [Anoxybacillus sp. ST4]MBW7652133.1 ThiF family adenylyltransferase [Anoxybacillus sp. ST4]
MNKFHSSLKPRFKGTIELLYLKNNQLVFNNVITRDYMIVETDEISSFFLRKINGENTIKDIKDSVRSRFTRDFSEDIDNYLNYLYQKNIIEFEDIAIPSDLKRYSNQIHFFRNFLHFNNAKEMQSLLGSKKVCVLGLGGTGSHIAYSLCAMGVGTLILNDHDYIEEKNLTRQALYCENDVGKSKSIVAKEKLSSINSSVSIITFDRRISQTLDLEEIIEGADLVINCMDDPNMDHTSIIVNDICQKMNIPFITGGGYNAHQTSLGYLIIPNKTMCFHCIRKAIQNHDGDLRPFLSEKRDMDYGSVVGIASIIANLQVLEAVKFLTNFSSPVIMNQHIELDFIHLSFRKTNLLKYIHEPCDRCVHLKGGEKNES